MKIVYQIAYTPFETGKNQTQSQREMNREYIDDITNKKTAFKKARKLLAEGCFDIFVDEQEFDKEMSDYKLIMSWDLNRFSDNLDEYLQ